MVNIKLDSKISLTSDSRQFMLCKEGRAYSYHMTLSAALISYLESRLRDSDAQTIQTLILRQKQLCAALGKVLAPHKISIEVQENE